MAAGRWEARALIGLELRKGSRGQSTLRGYAAVFNSESEDFGGWRERIAPGAFAKDLAAGKDIRALIDHDSARVIGRTPKTLRLAEDEKGLRVEIDLPDTTQARDLRASVERGDIDGMSFGFKVRKDRWEEGGAVRVLIDVELFEISVVAFPAYRAAKAGLRSVALSLPIKSKGRIETRDGNEIMDTEQLALYAANNNVPHALLKRAIEDHWSLEKFELEHIRGNSGRPGERTDVRRRFLPGPRGGGSSGFGGELAPGGVEDRSLGFSESDMRRYSIRKALRQLADGDKVDGLEGEVSQEIRRISGDMAKGSRGFSAPYWAFADKRERRDMTATGGSGGDQGGAMVQRDVGGLIEILRNRLRVRQLGATFLENLQGNLDVPKQASKSAATWKGETAAADESSPTFGQVSMDPNRVATFVEYSRQLLVQSSVGVEQFIRNDLTRAIETAIDAAAINGSGSGNEPRGILNTSGIGSVVGGANGAAPTRSHIVDLETQIAIDNADEGSLGYLTNAKVRGKLKDTKVDSGSGKFVWESDMLNGYRALVSNQVPSDLDKGTSTGICSAIIYGDWSQLVVGMWGPGIELLVNPYSKDTEGLIRVNVWSFADIAIRHAESFAAMQDALTD